MTSTKIPIAEGEFPGNLQINTQNYQINYMPQENELSPKLELAITMKKGISPVDEYRSIRFTNSNQIKSFITGMIQGYFLFTVKTKEINPDNFRYKLNKLFKDIEDYLMKTLK